MITALKNNRGDGYIDIVIAVLISMMVLVLSLNVFSFLTVKQDMDYFAKEMLDTATSNGSVRIDTSKRYNELCLDTGLSPDISWDADFYNLSDGTVQLGDTITVTVTYKTFLKGFGSIKIPITLTARQSGLSQKYWK